MKEYLVKANTRGALLSGFNREEGGRVEPSNLPKGFQRFENLLHFCAGVSIYLGQGLDLLRVESLPGADPNPPFGLILDSTVFR